MLSSNEINKWADFWHYVIGVNVIPANTKEKATYENWSQWQDKPIPDELHEQRKRNGEYNEGIAIITGQIWRDKNKGKYLNGIDCDNKKAIEEICNKDGKTISLEELAKWTIVEQHKDNPDKAHIYIMSTKPFKNKSSTAINQKLVDDNNDNEVPVIEVKCEKRIMFVSPSMHRDGYPYEILDCKEPALCDEFEYHLNNIFKKYGILYLDSNNPNDNNSYTSLKPVEELFKPGTKILEGHNRHEALLRVMESLLQRNRGILSLEKIKQLAYEWNQEICVPPLDDYEFNRQWNDALKFVGRSINSNTGESGDSNNKINNATSHGSAAEIIVELVLESSTLFKDEFGIPHALVNINKQNEVLPIKSNKLEYYLSKLYYENKDKKIPNVEAINNAKRTLGARAIFEGQTIPLHLRVAWSNDENKESIYYDMTDDKKRCIKIIKGNGWKLVENQTEVLFKRYGHETSQFEPSHDYDSKILDKFVNSLNIKNDNHKLLIKIWIISLLIPDISIPMLLPYGEKGSAKSTLQKKIKMLIDPSSLDLISFYDNKTQFIQQLSHNFLCFYDNVRHAPPWLSDETCRAITGGAFSKRELFTDDEDIHYKYKKRVSFSGINVIFTEEDALDRSIKLGLERIRDEDNIPETRLLDEFKQQIPQLLGYIFDVLSKALEIKDSVELERLPRMADFAEWGEAIARAIGYKPLEFMNAYFENIEEQNIDIITANPFADAISRFVDYDMNSWISSPQTLIKYLKEFADNNNIDNSKFPKNPQAISRKLNKIKSNLREGLFIEVIVDRITSGKGNKKQLNTAIIKIRKISPIPPISPVSKNDEGNEGKNIRDIEKVGDNTSNDNKISPVTEDQNHDQISSDIDKNGGIGDTGDIFKSLSKVGPLDKKKISDKSESITRQQQSYKCYYCDDEFSTEQEHLKHSVNLHPSKIAQPQDKRLFELIGIQPKGNLWEKL